MTRERIYGSDTEFCAWMRGCENLPSYSEEFGFVASDNDVTVHKYMSSIDAIGTREIQGLMQIEIKTNADRGKGTGKPSKSQIDTLSKLNLFAGSKTIDGCYVRFFGVFILALSGTTPDNSDHMWWCYWGTDECIDDAADCTKIKITKDILIKLLRFEIHPRTFDRYAFRRHHKTHEIVEEEITPLGLQVIRKIVRRS